MACTRAQSALQKGAVLSAPNDQGKHPQGTRKRKSPPRITRLQQRRPPSLLEYNQPCPSSTNKAPSRQVANSRIHDLGNIGTATPGDRGTKRRVDVPDHNFDSSAKRPRRSPRLSRVENTSDEPAANNAIAYKPTNPIEFWASQGQWPREYSKVDMEHLLARKKSLPSLGRKRSNSATSTSTTPSDQKPREEKSAPYRDPRYKALLATKGSFMDKSDLGIKETSKKTCLALLNEEQVTPNDSLFRDDLFEQTCRSVEDRNEARVLRDITPLIVPSAEILAIYGSTSLKCLIESVNEGWNNSVPLTGTRPQPDYSVGFRREAFTQDQLIKLSPFLGDFLSGDQSFFMSTYYMYFPFLTCEVKCGAAALDVADRQNAHSMTLATRGVTELFRAVRREDEVHRQILAFSVSHDHSSVRIYGHYPVIDGKNTEYYRHPIYKFDFTTLDGKEKWTAYRFTKNVYDTWMPTHFKKICSAIDQLPGDLNFNAPSLQDSSLSQNTEGDHLSQSAASSISGFFPAPFHPPVGQDSQSSDVAQPKDGTPGTSFTDVEVARKRRGRK